MIQHEEVRFDCLHFRGAIPCKPNKLEGVDCTNCQHYKKIETRILIIKLGALGDVIRSTPLLKKLRSVYPNAHITWLTHSPAILPQNEIEEILAFNFVSFFNIENTRFDIAINLDKDKEACLLLNKVDAKQKFGYDWQDGHLAPATPSARHKLMTGYFDHLSKVNTKSYLEEIFEICGFTFEKEEYAINLNGKLSAEWKQKLVALAGDKTIVGLNTGCGPRWNTRLWKDEYWIQTAKLLREKGYFPVFLGGELEHEKNQRLSQSADVFYPGHFSLEEFIALTDACDWIVTQVTMMMHIATALRKNMVLMNTIFNPHEFELYGRGQIVGPKKPCDCYFGNSCVHSEPCMMSILPEDILAVINKG